jgi:N-acetylglucosaminyldiphosphoundecaprenol N-acetyl-beta-D-mannosaminyltransferase
MSRAIVFGVPLDLLSMDATLDRIEGFIEEGSVHQHVVVNAAKVVAAQDDPELARTIANCDLVNIDGQAVVWATRLLGHEVPERVAGIDLMERLCVLAAERGYPVYFLGARSDIVQEVAAISARRWPRLVIAGVRDGYWSAKEEPHVVREVASSGAAILFVAIPSPRKEQFLARYKETLGVPFVMGVGGSFDVVAGRISRAPRWMQRAGLEWVFRLAQEPRRMFKRYLVGNSRFIALVVREWRAK